MKSLKLFFVLALISAWLNAYPVQKEELIRSNNGIHMRLDLTNQRHSSSATPTSDKTDRMQPLSSPAEMSDILPQGSKAVYGYLAYSTKPGFLPGLYELSDSGYKIVWPDPLYETYEIPIQLGFLKDDRICGYAIDSYYGYLFGMFYVEVDFNTGELLTLEELPLDRGYFLNIAYNTDDDTIYGYGIDNNEMACFMKADISNPGSLEVVRLLDSEMDICYSMTFNSVDGNIYGITRNNEFVSVGADGISNIISVLPFGEEALPYRSGLVYVPSQDLYYWNMTRYDYTTALYTIATSGEVDLINDYENEEAFNFFVTPDQPLNLDIPVKPTIDSINYSPGSLIGSVTITLPTQLKSGVSISGNVEYTLLVDNLNEIRGTAAPGEKVTIQVEEAVESGFHTFSIWVSYDGNKSAQVSERVYLGYDAPLAPTDVVLTADAVTWNPVSSDEGIHGGFVDLEKIEYVVSLNGEVLGKTSACTYPIILPDAELTPYIAEVYASVNGFDSSVATSNKIVEGKPLSLPLRFAPTEEEFELMTVVDSNSEDSSDGWTWKQNRFWYDGDQVYILPNFYVDGLVSKDYLFLPLFHIEDSEKYYTWSMEAKGSYEENNNEVFSVYLAKGNSPEDILYKVMDVHDMTNEFKKYESVFNVPEAGDYTIVLFYGSDYTQSGIYARDFVVEDNNLMGSSPGNVTDLEAVESAPGALRALVSFKFPEFAINNTPLKSDLRINATIKCVNEVIVSGIPGQAVEGLEVETSQGDNIISVSIEDAEGNNGLNSYVNIYTGVVIPQKVKEISLETSPDMKTVYFSWVPPTEGVNGGYINPAELNYRVYRMWESAFGSYWDVLEDVGNATSFVYEPNEQDVIYLGVETYNIAGTTEELLYGYILAGPPYVLPFTETFQGSEYYVTDTKPWMNLANTEDKNSGRWTLKYLADQEPYLWADTEDVCLIALTDEDDSIARLGMPRFATSGLTNVSLKLLVSTRYGASFTIKGIANGMAEAIEIEVPEFDCTEGEFVPVVVTLPDQLLDCDWVQIYIDAELPNTDSYMALVNVEIRDEADTLVVDTSIGRHWAFGEVGRIVINSDQKAIIITTDGKLIATTEGDATVDLAKGLYIVHFQDKYSVKVMVK